MRIISKYRDYYDNVSGVLYDDYFIYHRQPKSITPTFRIFDNMSWFNDSFNYDSISFIGFCGEVIPVYITKQCIDGVSEKDFKIFGGKILKCVKPFDSFLRPTVEYYINYDMTSVFNMVVNRRKKRRYDNYQLSRTLSRIESEVDIIKKMDLFDMYETPIFHIYSGRYNALIDISPCLKDLNFQCKYNPYQAFQELVMWIGNQAVNEYPVQITDDIVLRDKKGFDQYSFKKRKTENI